MNKRTCPLLLPFPSFKDPPIANKSSFSPVVEIAKESPKESPSDSPSILEPICSHLLLLFWKTRTFPLAFPLLSLRFAPIAINVPSVDKLIAFPKLSPIFCPSILSPICCQLPSLFLNIRTCPLSSPLSSLLIDPIATTEPSAERLTEYPDKSLLFDPNIVEPTCTHSSFWFWKTFTEPR